ncbi:DUF3181 family protein [Laspinema olomoucense]|uniref:DUF3181 family protein n=1 Tax=Laspinema olomoucense D3b TaxID=2953688 RepID=A0ABT2N387_9CYAN|nr:MULTISPECIES: DUF3181 family protein [unclassified Laspinema]MCT7976215.1 DUF3181 family protein [Laspinema sp. D3b]MCT7989963.1 DUF3181 family protein [Laspinema sp. D3a]MCT7995718.1 DUF3181 family protein [Laspinema sp. D3c]
MANSSNTEKIEALAAQIADRVYIDVAKWRLRLDDAHLHTLLAEQLYPLVSTNAAVNESDVSKVLAGINVNLGGGRRQIPLSDLIPTGEQMDLLRILEEFQRDL